MQRFKTIQLGFFRELTTVLFNFGPEDLKLPTTIAT